MVFTLLSVDDFLGMKCTPNMKTIDYLLAVSEVYSLKSKYGEEDYLIDEQDKEFRMEKEERITQNIRSILSSFPQVLHHPHQNNTILDCSVPKGKRSRKSVENNSEEESVVKVDNGIKNRLIKIGWYDAANFVKPIGVSNQEFVENRAKPVDDMENRAFKSNDQERVMNKKLGEKSEAIIRAKKRKIVYSGEAAAAPPVVIELRIEFKNQITHIGGSLESVKLVIEKTLFDTDVNPAEGRFSIPEKKMCNRFLNPGEEELLNTRNGTNMCEMNVTLIEPSLRIGEINLRKWNMNKKNGKASSMYVLVTYWNDVKRRNGLKSGMKMQLWAFRKDEKLCFALVKV